MNKLFAIVVAILTIGCSSSTVTMKPNEARKVPVRTVAVVKKDVQRTTMQPASIHAFYRTAIRAKAAGYVGVLQADIGDHVEAGATLAVIEVPEMQVRRKVIEARVRRLVAEEKRSEAGVNLAKAGVLSAEAKYAESKSMVGSAEAILAASEAEFNRTQDMVQRGSLQDRMLDEARKKRDSQLANADAVRSAVDSAEAEVTVAQAQKTSAEADLEAAKAETDVTRRELDELDVLIAYATIKAPFAGIITERNVEPGDLVRETNDDRPLFVISKIDKVRVRIPVPESDAAMVNQGDVITLTFPSFADEPAMEATVTRRAGGLDPSTRTMLVEAEIENPQGKLLPGMFGQASINLDTKVAANMLPARAIRFDESGKAYVYVVGQGDTVTVANIETGLDDGNTIEVLTGIELGQQVIDSHLKRFTDGQEVAVLN
ncbi:MAG: efflux RND transporter periplasmic adaptor subunit [Rubripirellula sp.]